MQTVEEGRGSVEEQENHKEVEILKLRKRWELASVLNFLDVFSPLIGKELKLSAEEIEMGLVKPEASLAQLHIVLLKGLPPVSKTLVDTDKWVTVLCKKLSMWWPWVAEGDIPLKPSKGEEISKYKELAPTDRLILLKALCEIRADQHDAVAYINDGLKEGTKISSFRKDALGKDGTGTFYWYDSNAQGHRLYKETLTSDSNSKVNIKKCLSLTTIHSQWETLAVNLQEFSKVVENFSSSEIPAEVAISKKLQSDAIPILEKLQKKKEKAAKQKKRQDMLLNDLRNSDCSGNTRSCRTRRRISYTFEAYDRTIKEAIQLSKKRKISPSADLDRSRGSEDKSNMKDVSTDSDSGRDVLQISDSDDTGYEIENHSCSEEDYIDSELGNLEANTGPVVCYPRGVRWNNRLAGVSSHFILESSGLTTRQRLRQRPTRNSAVESIIVPDSEDKAEKGKTDLLEST